MANLKTPLSWSSVPPRIKRTGQTIFTIPVDLKSGKLLPSTDLSLKGLTDFSLPPQSTPPSKESPISLAGFFSTTLPFATVTPTYLIKLRHLVTPDAATIQQLVEFSRQAWLDGAKSVRYAHLESDTITYFPLWVITYWNAVLDTKKVRNHWINSRDWITVQLKQKKSLERQQLAETASIMLSTLPWGAHKPTGFGFSEGSDPICNLWRYLGPNWLSCSEQNDMLELIRGIALDMPAMCSKLRIQNTHFTNSLLDAFSSSNYHTNNKFSWLRHLGDDLARGAILMTIVHLGEIADNRHWVPLVVQKDEILYGDSFKTGMPQKLKSACLWWVGQHASGTEPTIKPLPITAQVDKHSCGVLADNALRHYISPADNPLLGAASSDITAQRLKLFNNVALNIITRLDPVSSLDGVDIEEDTPDPEPEVPQSAFTFTCRPPSLESSTSKPSSAESKLGRGHHDAPTPQPSPSKKRQCLSPSNRPSAPLKQPIFAPATSTNASGSSAPLKAVTDTNDELPALTNCDDWDKDDLFGSDPIYSGCSSNLDVDFADTAPVSPDFKAARPSHLESKDSIEDEPPALIGWGGHKEDDFDDGPDDDGYPSDSDDDFENPVNKIQVKMAKVTVPAPRGKLTLYWAVAMQEEKEEANQRDFQQLRDNSERAAIEAELSKQRTEARKRASVRDRVGRFREREKERKVAAGWVPGRKRKRVSLEEFDDIIASTSTADDSRPRRQFKEDQRKKKKVAGRTRTHDQQDCKRVNWFSPFLWMQIENAAVRAGKPWKPRAIVKEAHRLNSKTFGRLTEQVVGRWIDQDAKGRGVSKWKESVLDQVAKGNSPGGESNRVGVLCRYPEIVDSIKSQLTSLRDVGVALTTLTIRAIMVANIQKMAPQLFHQPRKDGTYFKCSDAFVWKFLHNTMGWSNRRATKAAQKLPANYEQVLTNAFLREASIVRDHAVPAALRVNTDQTQLVYQQGTQQTWMQSGAKQVSTVGQEEKRAFTLVPSISASGVLLPMQSIFHGKTAASCPSLAAPSYAEARRLGYVMLPSRSATYWSTQESMRALVNDIIAPYFDKTKANLDLPHTQCSIWKIDCWSVHKSDEFLSWMRKKHPNIIVVFVPGGCTGVFQPLDVGIQRVLKLSMKRSAHHDIVEEVTTQMAAGVTVIKVDTTLGNLRDRSVGWVVNAIHDIDNKDLIIKAFELCRAGPFNLSHASMTSPQALEALRNLRNTDPNLFKELSSETDQPQGVFETEDEPTYPEIIDDASDIPINVVREHVASGSRDASGGYVVGDDGGLLRASEVEDPDTEADDALQSGPLSPAAEKPGMTPLGRGHRKKTETRPFGGSREWWEH